MSAFEQRVETPDRNYQYVLFAAEPYETIAFKIPNKEIERDLSTGKFQWNWDEKKLVFTLQIYFKEEGTATPPPKRAEDID
jgi:splicing factor 3A subunit 2